jgi:pimeloyl-ACP methyl ester carboxylesterase
MARTPVADVIVLLPGITGSVLQKDGKDVWAISGGAFADALKTLGKSIAQLELARDDPELDDLGDGITAPRVIPDTHLIPGLWKIDGYGKVARTIKDEFDVTPGINFFEFPYDWRRDNRVHARRLARESQIWLAEWRRRSGNSDAKLILIAHSMGGLISRQFLELHEGWRDTRLLLTFGTPYRGSLNALEFLVHGMRKQLGPITLMNLSALIRSFTSVYQLLPIYPCIQQDEQDGLARVTEIPSIPGVDAAKAADALRFHHAISDAVKRHRSDVEYREHGYQIRPIAGVFQPTLQSARLRAGGTLESLRSYDGVDQGGDGTVPSVSATPIELSNQDLEVYVREKHASLQNADFTLDQVVGLLRRQRIDQAQVFAPGKGISLAIEDAYLSGTPMPVRALPELEWETLSASLEALERPALPITVPLTAADDGWHEALLPPLPEGTYRLTVAGTAESNPVTDIFAVLDEGTDAG